MLATTAILMVLMLAMARSQIRLGAVETRDAIDGSRSWVEDGTTGEVGRKSTLETREGDQLGAEISEVELTEITHQIRCRWIWHNTTRCLDNSLCDTRSCGEGALGKSNTAEICNRIIRTMLDPGEESLHSCKLVHIEIGRPLVRPPWLRTNEGIQLSICLIQGIGNDCILSGRVGIASIEQGVVTGIDQHSNEK